MSTETSAASAQFERVLKLADLPAGSKKAVEINGKCVLVCNVNSKLFAISNICSHNEKPLERGRLGNGWIACPTHGARFDLATGAALNLPAKLPVATFEVRTTDEWIEVLV
ncbi:Rieske (2Fe-2S) protein [Stenotrophobium rhamnosiphilum]|uniref:Rieske (2Fe-2S) protein n=1 Tax=Stenotrophobium rhamnosiphilum TaxID=2029166 RepID=UPI0019D0D917|nr:non-heme iron oxygenase ferredoxin subunit [Stenotrophobium rhamnosiphilum]